MKNFTKLFLIVALFTATSTFANGDGHTSGGGKTCPNGQTTCLVAETDVDSTEKGEEPTVFEILKDFFKGIFE